MALCFLPLEQGDGDALSGCLGWADVAGSANLPFDNPRLAEAFVRQRITDRSGGLCDPYLITLADYPAGYCCLHYTGSTVEPVFALTPALLGRGYGHTILAALVAKAHCSPSARVMSARCRAGNFPAIATFMGGGFTRSNTAGASEITYFFRELDKPDLSKKKL